MKYSVVVPVYNRPGEVNELLDSLTKQTFTDFEVIIVEDGSTNKCDHVVKKFEGELTIHYFFKENSGQGFSRNFGFERAIGDFMIVFDSDCIIPPHYFKEVDDFLSKKRLDAFGGPDKAHPNFNHLQKAISYSMTSFFTTGGIRGGKKHVGKFHPRSFNMGISKEVFEATQGYIIPRLGEDIEFSIRINKKGFKTGLIPNAFVYHKRRTSLKQFWKQLHFFGRARINIGRFFPKEIKLVHLFPAAFVLGLAVWILSAFLNLWVFSAGALLVLLWSLGIVADSSLKNNSLKVGVYSLAAAFIQLTAYGIGFVTEASRYSKSPYDASAGK